MDLVPALLTAASAGVVCAFIITLVREDPGARLD